MELRPVGLMLQQARKAKRLRQEDLARLTGIKRRRISDFERGKAFPTPAEAKLLAGVLGLIEYTLTVLTQPATAGQGRLMRLFGRRPRSYVPPRGPNTWRCLAGLRKENRATLARMLMTLRDRRDWDTSRRFLNEIIIESRDEALAWLLLLLVGVAARLSPLRCGFTSHAVIHPDTHEVIGHLRMPALVCKRNVAVIFPQLTLLRGWEHPRPDGIVGIRVGDKMLWCAIEFDGPFHDPMEDHVRDQKLGLPVVRFALKELRKPDFVETFWRRIRAALGCDAAA